MSLRLFGLAALVALLSAVSAAGGAAPPADRIDALVRPVCSGAHPGCAVLVVKDGRTLLRRGYGVADLRTGAPITARTNVRLASLTKQFTATAILLLARDGALRYDDPLGRFFPDFPAWGRAITVRQLLTHTSGLPDYEDIYEQRFAGTPGAPVPQLKDADVLKILEQQRAPAFAAGTQWRYSNSGYAVLAMIVQKVSGEPFGDFLRERIFRPLGMRHTIAYEKGKNEVARRAFGYCRDGESWKFCDESPTSAVLGDGGVYSSLDDLARWDRALASHTLLSAAEMRPALTPAAVPGTVQYGFGWFLDSYRGRRRMYHDGETIGFRTTIQRFLDERLTIVVLANRADLNADALALKIADLFAPPSPR